MRAMAATWESEKAPGLFSEIWTRFDRGELLPKYAPTPLIASFMRDPDDPASVARDAIPVPKGPVEVW